MKDIITETLIDWRHWVGWVFTFGMVVGIVSLTGLALYTPWYRAVLVFMTIVFTDVLKHKLDLQ